MAPSRAIKEETWAEVAGRADLLVFRSDGRDGYLTPERIARTTTEADGPVLLFANGFESLFLADMNSDGLGDLVSV